jgi:hypothetical protein
MFASRTSMASFRVCLNQGINVRLIDDEAAEALSSIEYRDDQFRKRTLYTAWDNLRDERIFFEGVDRLNRAGIPSRHVMAYMLVGFNRLSRDLCPPSTRVNLASHARN